MVMAREGRACRLVGWWWQGWRQLAVVARANSGKVWRSDMGGGGGENIEVVWKGEVGQNEQKEKNEKKKKKKEKKNV